MAEGADLPFGLASAVGPVPFASADDAVAFALRRPRYPTVPVTSDPSASLWAQAVSGLDDGIGPDAAGADLSGPAFAAAHAFVDALAHLDVASVPVAIRVPVLGPVTVASELRRLGRPAEDADRIAVEVVSARAVALLGLIRAAGAVSGSAAAPVVSVVLEEPGLVGSMHPTYPRRPAEIRSLLDPVIDALDRAAPSRSLLIGVHVAGPCDWPSVIGSGASLLCVPVDRTVSGWAPLFGDLLDRGGRICWGVVPVDRPLGRSTDRYWRRLVALWTAMVAEGVDPMALRLRSSFSPADGLDAFGPSQAELVMELTAEVAERVSHQAVAARLSLGA